MILQVRLGAIHVHARVYQCLLTRSKAHLAEETENAAWVVPNAMWISCVSVAVLGYVFNVSLAYATPDIDAVFDSPLGQPLGAILHLTLGGGAFTKVLWLFTVLSNFGVVFVNNTAGTRVYFAYARDGALPFSRWLSHVNTVTKTPINASIALSLVFASVGLISLGSPSALQAFFSGSSLAGSTAYLMPVLMRFVDMSLTILPSSANLIAIGAFTRTTPTTNLAPSTWVNFRGP